MEHVCKLCKKSFLSGRVLGGHMRCHGAKKSAKTEKNIEMCRAHSEVEDDDHAGYGLRVNPKKSWKFSGHSKFEASAGEEKEFVCRCRVCGKGFHSMRAMFGHMRHHSGRERKEAQSCEVCGKEFETLRALATHSRCHSKSIRGTDGLETVSSSKKLAVDCCQYSSETMGLIRKKRSKRLRYKITNSSCSFSSFSVNESKYVTEFGEEVVEGAICLMIISGCGSNWDRISSVTESSDNNSLSLEVQSPGLKNWIMGNKGGVSVCDDTVKFVDCISDGKNVSVEKKVLEFSENNSGFANDEEKNVETEDRFFRGVGYKRPRLDEESVFGLCDAEMEMNLDIIKEVELDVAAFGSMKSGLNNKPKFYATESEVFADSQKKREHKCRLCNKVFSTYQALGGHQRVHKSTSTTSLVNIEDYEDRIPINKFSKMEYSCKLAKPECSDNSAAEEKTERVIENKGHKCSICLKVFATGQALGGHKRVHFGKDPETGAEESRVLKQQISDICDAFDLSRPIENGDVDFKSWWPGNEHKQELLMDLMPN
ncbi:uncharacterized protein LOC126610018 [Malus sylvestris]|uniref:uncharacterized protein LOC126610018 n=1 Tax=Malus sylvestris TaxID=3752 RepID=UPI0021ABFE55|nr:uncharacterized protein LOC126610018 [Malus sylvestris]